MKARIIYDAGIKFIGMDFKSLDTCNGFWQVEFKTGFFWKFYKEFTKRKDAEEFLASLGMSPDIWS